VAYPGEIFWVSFFQLKTLLIVLKIQSFYIVFTLNKMYIYDKKVINMQIELSKNALVIHNIMQQAFLEYDQAGMPSSALKETIDSVQEDLENGEQAFVGYDTNRKPVAMVRFQVKESYVYFYRLSVLPECQGKGYAKQLLKALEVYARQSGIPEVRCKVRKNVDRNVLLYTNAGFQIYEEEHVQLINGNTIPVISMKKQIVDENKSLVVCSEVKVTK